MSDIGGESGLCIPDQGTRKGCLPAQQMSPLLQTKALEGPRMKGTLG